ncbi:SLC13 family permease [Apilactobacillus ozensis]|nr:SLC13 family permease [Apilactobacillus ozensis]
MVVLVIFLISTALVGKPSLNDVNWNTIFSLMMLMAFVALISEMHILDYFSNLITMKSNNSRIIIIMLVLFDYFASMFFTNDVLILALIPLFIKIANQYHLKKAYPLTLLTIAANLGSSVTPIGNPQNIFLVSNYYVNVVEFFKYSYIFGIIGFAFILCLSFFAESKTIFNSDKHSDIYLKPVNVFIAVALMVIVLLGIFSIINVVITLIITILIGCIFNYKIIYRIDYGLLLSFIGFFLIVGIFSRSVIINSFISGLATNQRSVFILSALTSQIISNVPASVLIAKFSTYMPAIYYGVSVGGLGTMVASLANLLALKQVTIYSKKDAKKFIVLFSFLNFLLLFLFIIIFYSII